MRAAHEERGEEIPDHLFPPDVLAGYGPWLDEFWGASSERQLGMGVGPIPISALRSSAMRLDLDGEEEGIFIRVMRRLDTTYLKEVNKELEDGNKRLAPSVATRSGSIELFDALFS